MINSDIVESIPKMKKGAIKLSSTEVDENCEISMNDIIPLQSTFPTSSKDLPFNPLESSPHTSMSNIPLPLMVRFKRALILKNTDASSFISQANYGELIVGIRQITDELIEAIEAARDREFQ